MSPQREKIAFEPNVPIVCTLEFDGGKQVPARDGVQYLYWVDGQRSMFLDPPAHEQIQAAGLKAGDTMEITKTLHGRKIGWEVIHVVDPDQEEPAPPPPLRSQPRTSTPTRPDPQPRQQPAPPIEHATSHPCPGPVTTQTLTLLSAFQSTIDALAEARKYATMRGIDMPITAEMIRTTAISVYIAKQPGGAK